jgi:predicted amidohydrolase
VIVALLQLRASPGRELEVGLRACREAAARGADLALFPELWQVGYALDSPGLGERATDVDGEFVGAFRALARELGMAIVATYLQRGDAGPRNAATVIDRRGEPVLTYAKVHTCDFAPEAALEPGEEFLAADLELADGERVRIGVMICYDREFPESARALMLAGAEIILTPNACPLNDDRVGQFRARAFENMVGVAMANYAAPTFDGRSVAFSGICCAPDGAPLDHRLVEAGPEPGIVLAEFDLAALRAYRARETLGDAYRKPGAYAALVADAPAPVFERADSRRRWVAHR